MSDMQAVRSDTDRVEIFANGKRIGPGVADLVDNVDGVVHLTLSPTVTQALAPFEEIVLVTDDKKQYKARIYTENGQMIAKLIR